MAKQYLSAFPNLIKEWDYEKNIGLDPNTITHGSGLIVYWRCSKCGNSWMAKINNRTNGKGCPVCRNRKIVKGHNDLVTTHPNIAKEWDYNLNGNLTPSDVSYGCNKKVHWICPKGHSYIATVNHRTGKCGTGCPICNSGRQTSFAEQTIFYYVKQFHKDAISRYKDIFNNGMELDIYIPSLRLAIEYDGGYWHKDKHHLEMKKFQICQQNKIKLIRITEGTDKPNIDIELAANKVFCLTDSTNRDDFNMFIRCFLSHIEQFYHTNIWHKLDIDVERDKFKIREYMQETSQNSLESTHPDLVKEWNYEKNNGLTPSMFFAGSSEKVWWICSSCGHEWQASIYHRTHGTGCEKCYRAKNRGETHVGSKKIYQFTLDGEFIKEWGSLSDVKTTLGINVSNISMCAQHKRPNAGGFRWEYRYFEALPPLVKRKRNPNKPTKTILQIGLDGQIVNEFNSLNDAGQYTGTNPTSISKVINGHTKTAGGFVWKQK